MLVDYGNLLRVPRNEIWAPVNELKLFNEKPFGINCRVDRVLPPTFEKWFKLVSDKSLHVEIPQMNPEGRYFMVTIPDCAANAGFHTM